MTPEQTTTKLIDMTGIGNACMDIVADCDYAFLERHAVKKSHCVYVDLKTLETLKSELREYDMIAGGAAANTVYAFRSLGGSAAFQGKIATDREGFAFRKSMEDADIATLLSISPDDDIGSTQVISLRTPDGDRSFVTYQGVAETISPEDFDYSQIAGSRIVYYDGYTMYSPFAFEAFAKATQDVHQGGGVAVFNPGDLSILEQYKEDVARLVENIDMVICNLAEARSIFSVDTLDECARKLPLLKRTGAVTDGANGAVIFHDGEVIAMPPPVSRFAKKELYTLGAGDHFSAGFLYGYARNFTLKQMGKLAELCALECIGHPGARPLSPLAPLTELALKE